MRTKIQTKWGCGGVAIVLLLALGACGSNAGDSSKDAAEREGRSGASLKVDFVANTDVTGFRFTIKKAEQLGACQTSGPQQQAAKQTTAAQQQTSGSQQQTPDFFLEVDKPLEEIVVPGGPPTVAEQARGRRVFADYFTVLPSGCYDVLATPLRADGSASAECSVSREAGVAIQPERVTEIYLLSQCLGEQTGGLDTAIVSNKGPQITELTFNPSKFTYACEKTQVCVKVVDENGDALQLRIHQTKGAKLYTSGPEKVMMQPSAGPGWTSGGTACFDLAAQQAGDYLFDIDAFDLYDAQNGITYEDHLTEMGTPHDSHAVLRDIPLHVAVEPQALCWDGGQSRQQTGSRPVVTAAGCVAPDAAQYYCEAKNAAQEGFDITSACPNGQFSPASTYPACK